MTFSKAIQIKHLVNRWNKTRKECDFGIITFTCLMFSIGNWSVDIQVVGTNLFFSEEMDELITLYAGGGFRFTIHSHNNRPFISMQ